MQEGHVLDKQANLFPLLESQIKEMRELHKAKLWYQLSLVLLKYVEEPVLQAQSHLIELYEGFIKEIESSIDEISCVQLASKASDQYEGLEQKLVFLKKINDTVLSDKAAKLLNKTKIAEHKLNHGKVDDAWTDISELTKEIENISDLDPIVYSNYYSLTSAYYKTKENYEEFYKNSLQYLAYTHESKIKESQKRQISMDMGIACLVSDKIYNFSELLEQPVLMALKDTQEHAWIYNLLGTFNAGDIVKFESDLAKYKELINNNMIMSQHVTTLKTKIKIMALLELVFNRPKNDRNVNFETIAKVTGLQVKDVETLVIKAMSKNLIKGSIDQVEQKVKVTWIMPRVLDTERIVVMKKKLDSWNKTLETLVKTVESGNNFAAASFV